MKKLLVTLIVFVLILSVVGCNKNQPEDPYIPINEFVGENLQNNEVETHVMPRPFGVLLDGDMNRNFYEPCEVKFDGIPAELIRLVEESDYENWRSKHNIFAKAPSGLTEYLNIYSFIVEFDIPDREVLSALSVYLQSDDPTIAMSEEDVNIILSKDEVAIIERFATEYSIVVGEHIYSPQWIYENSIEAYKDAGISPEMIKDKLSLYGTFSFTYEAAKAFQSKLSEFIGEAVHLPSVTEDLNIREYSLEWLTSHTIQDYEEANITVHDLETLLLKMLGYEKTKEYEWIKSCHDRMIEDAGIPKDESKQIEISYDEIKTLVDLDFTFTNYTHYASDMISLNQEEYVIKDPHMYYFKITDPNLDTWADWEEFCKSIYCSDLLNSRMSKINNTVIDIEGYAYILPRGQGRPISTDYECKIIEQKDGHAVAQAIYKDIQEDTYGREIVYTYEFEYTQSGWRIVRVSY